MPSIELHPTTVYKNGSLVGSGLWSDGSDSTSVSLTRTPTSSGDGAHGWIPALDLGAIPGGASSVIQLVFHMRIAATTTDGSGTIDTSPQIVFNNPGGGGSVPFSDLVATNTVPANGTAVDVQHAVSGADYANLGLSMATVVNRLTGSDPSAPGQRAIRFGLSGSTISYPAGATWTFAIYEAWLEVVYQVSNPAPLRLYPRSQTRLYPRRRTRRPGTF